MNATGGANAVDQAPLRPGILSPARLAVLFALLTLFGAFYKGHLDRVPYADERFYVQEGIDAVDGGFLRLIDRRGSRNSDVTVMPLYPAFLGVVFSISDRALDSARCTMAQADKGRGPCDLDFSAVFWPQYLLAAFTVALSVWFVAREFRSSVAGALAGAFLLAAGLPLLYANRYLTEAVYFPLVAVFLVTLYYAVRDRGVGWTVLCGVSLGLLALSRASYIYAVLPAVAVLIFARLPGARRPFLGRLVQSIGFSAVFFAILGPWFWANYTFFGSLMPTSTGIVLVSRVTHNKMTPQEYAAGWVFWLPDFGDSLSEKLFGRDAVERLKFEGRGSFYRVVRGDVMGEAEAYLKTARPGPLSKEERANALRSWLISEKIFGDLPKHVAVSLLLSWRGVFVGKYAGMIGLAALVALFCGAWGRPYRWPVATLAAVPVFVLGLQAFTSLNIPRYNVAMLFPMAVATGLMLSALIRWGATRLHRGRSDA